MISKREQNKEKRRATILDNAIHLFDQQGYDATTTRQVIQAANMPSATFYQYFADKHAVFKTIAINAIDTTVSKYEAQLADKENFTAQDLATLINQKLEQGPFSPRLIADFTNEFSGQHGDFDVYNYYQERVRTYWRHLITRLRHLHLISPTLSDEALMLYFQMWISFFGSKENMKHFNMNLMPDLMPQFSEIFLFGMLDPEQKTRENMLTDIRHN
ncbi:TetR/AcrR family transcriptional regulator [Weissella confusa]|uniref:TetR/AcrR family transcriptional regulator n=1 Tax=Weissella fermenti TaxID=2987699 RepID=A0ABT6D7W5_9LACO|nr:MULTISPECIES: TetR/AcrR family transcriptional regulator [Weissella]MBJ7689364.1 TetR/AcrR family transcriptional regulator [Weissella confusa]MCW0925881.1 TetR/AcrR family transcriptional regulator [Weissella sp. LMG 11983]MCW0928144.1 TetR/AcrR family transcriptional regulator [Weissella sp. LMG 11983]MDF9300738.1 TetR/AcrR family transcriptional regulator [Weissella sp. BK2]